MAEHRNGRSKVAFISGASKGLGRALANFLAAQGFDLIITARNERQLMESAERIREQGGLVRAVAADVSKASDRQHLLEAVRPFGHLDLLINNASSLGPLPMPSLLEYRLDDLRQVFETNTLAPLALVQLLQPYLAAGHGLVINLSSDAANGGYQGWGGYGASKAALDLISLTLANELGDDGISVTSVDPGDMRTDMQQDAYPGEDISDRSLPEATLPFWAWLLGQEPADISGRRFQAQSELWEVPA